MGLATHVLAVLRNPGLFAALVTRGRATAERFTPEAACSQMETALYAITTCSPELLQLRQRCMADIRLVAAWASTACTPPVPTPAKPDPQALPSD